MNTVDFSCPGWGHQFTVTQIGDGGLTLNGMGHFSGRIERGDFFILSNKGSTTRYKVDEIEWLLNPSDMFSATLSFAPRSE